MKTVTNLPYGAERPPEVKHFEDEVRMYYNVHSQTCTDEEGNEYQWYFADADVYSTAEYIAYLESVLESRQEETDELIAEILEGD